VIPKTFIQDAEREEQPMKFKHIFLTTLALLLAVSSAVYSRGGMGGKTVEAQGKPSTVICPDKLQIGPVYVSDGWQSLGSLPWPIIATRVDTQTQMIVCEYGNKGSLFFTFFISQKFPAGYDCKVTSPAAFRAECTKKIRVRPGGR
jgi:hypothetical protein